MTTEHKPHSTQDDFAIVHNCISEFSTRNQSVPWATDAYAALRRLEEQLEAAEKQRQFAVDRADVEMDRRRRLKEQLESTSISTEALLVAERDGLREQLETRVTNARRRFQAIYNETDIEVVQWIAYDGIAEVSGQEWRDLTASNPATQCNDPWTPTEAQAEAILADIRNPERCNAIAPGSGRMLCDREPGHEGFHANWRGAEWNDTASIPAKELKP